MVAQVLRLKLILLGNAFRRTPLQVVGLLFALIYGLGTALFLSAGLIALRFVDVEVAHDVVIVFGALAFVIFALLPLMLGIDDVLDPRRFALYGMSNTLLATSIATASLVSVPAIVIGIIAFAQISTWSRGELPLVLAVVSALLIVLTCVLSARITTTLATFLLAARRTRDATTIVGIALVVAAAPLIVLLASVDWGRDGLGTLGTIADVVGWTPLGAAWAAPADAAAGLDGPAIAKLVIAIVWLAVLALVWRALLAAILVRPPRQAQAKRFNGIGWFDRLAGNPAGVIAARSVTYWTRDARYLTNLVIVPIIPAAMIVALLIAGVPLTALALLPVPIICLFLSWSIHNDVSLDNTAIWLHLVSSTSGRADRIGRLAPALALGIIVVLVGSVASIAVFGDWSALPSMIGVSSCILFVGLGLSSFMSARFPYPAVRPDDSPFSQPQAGGNSAGLIQGLSFFGILVLALPSIVAAFFGLALGGPWHWVSLAAGLVVGIPALLGGIQLGARAFDRRGHELLAAALRN